MLGWLALLAIDGFVTLAIPDEVNREPLSLQEALRTATATVFGGALLVAVVVGGVWLAVQLTL